jgi:hypothetical protein
MLSASATERALASFITSDGTQIGKCSRLDWWSPLAVGSSQRDKEGKVNTVRYDAVNAMLLNEFLKEHRSVEELKKEIAMLTATVKEQAAQIQKVSDQLELSKPAPQVVNNN